MWDAAPAGRRRSAHRPHRRGARGGVQPRRAPDRLRQLRPDGAGVGRRHRPAARRAAHRPYRAVYGVAFSPDGHRLSPAATTRPCGCGTPHRPADGAPLTGHTTRCPAWRSAPTAPWPPAVRQDGPAVGCRHRRTDGAPLTGHTDLVRAWRSAPTAPARLRQCRQDGAGVGRQHRPTRRPPSPATPAGVRRGVQPRRAPDRHRQRDNTVRVWDAAPASPSAHPLTGHTGAVSAVAFSPDGQRLAIGSNDTRCGCGTPPPASGRRPVTGHTGSVVGVAFSPDGHRSPPPATTTRCGCGTPPPATVGAPAHRPHRRGVGVAFSPDGRRLVSPAPIGCAAGGTWPPAADGAHAHRPHRRGDQRGLSPDGPVGLQQRRQTSGVGRRHRPTDRRALNGHTAC